MLWDRLSNLSWKKALQMIGMVIGALLLLVIIVTCCVFPLILIMISKTLKLFRGQFPLQIQNDITVELTKTDMSGEPSTDNFYEEIPPQNLNAYMSMSVLQDSLGLGCLAVICCSLTACISGYVQ